MIKSSSEVGLGGLLHDVGKVYQRAYGNQPPPGFAEEGFTHQDYTAYFVRHVAGLDGSLAERAKRHHTQNVPDRLRPRPGEPLDWIVHFAASYAGGEGSENGTPNVSTATQTPLTSIFSQLKIGERQAPECVYPFLPTGRVGLAPGMPYPVEPSRSNTSADAYLRLVQHIESRVSKLKKLAPTPDVLLANLGMIFLEALWGVPADTSNIQGISLYDHLRLSAAFAAALFAYHQEQGLSVEAVRDETQPKFLLVGGDMSGIQSHIYRIKNAQGQGGIAKRLRARSLEVSLAAEAMALGLLERLWLPPVQRIMSAGGKFYALLPNTAAAETALQAHREAWEAWALEQGAGLLPVLSDVAFSPNELKEAGFDNVFQKLGIRMAETKLRPLSSQISLFPEPFQHRQGQSRRPCAVCGVRPAASDEPGAACTECSRDREVGTRLPRTRSITATASPQHPYYRFPELSFDFGHKGYILRSDADFSPAGTPWELRPLLGHLPTVGDAMEQLGHASLDDFRAWMEASSLGSEDDTPLHKDRPLTYGELAHLSEGASYLGALMLDADRMGETFTRGFEHLSKPMSPGRIATLSRAIETFFTLEVGGLIQDATRYREHLGFSESEARSKSQRYRLIYTVYSGGDDLFLVGPWDVLLDFALDLNNLYRRYTTHPSLTLSGGFALLRPTTPVPMIYESAHRAEAAAKERGKDPESPTRGQGHLALFGQAVSWPALQELAPWARWLSGELRAGRFPSALAYRLLKLHRRFENERDEARRMFYKPQLAYLLRNYSDNEKFPEYRERLGMLLDHTRPEWAHLPVWVEWGLYGARGRKG